MIVVDTSALMAILLKEREASNCTRVMLDEEEPLISAGTLAEALVVADRRNVGEEMRRLIDEFGFRIVPLSALSARRVAQAYADWGKGIHPAGLNLGDCFAYALAKEHRCPLLFVGDDFASTDVARAT